MLLSDLEKPEREGNHRGFILTSSERIHNVIVHTPASYHYAYLKRALPLLEKEDATLCTGKMALSLALEYFATVFTG